MTPADIKDLTAKYQINDVIQWHGFGVCSALLPVAAPWLQKAKHDGTCGVIFKIRSCAGARDISGYSYSPWQQEAMFLKGTQFRVTAQLSVTPANLGLVIPQSVLFANRLETGFVRPTKINHDTTPTLVVIELEEI